MSRRRWFLPESPDVLGLLRGQVAVTREGIDALGAWAAGDPAAAQRVRDLEHAGDAAKRELLGALRAAFVTPLEPEDAFALSRGIDRLLNYARDLVGESEGMACPPDARIAEMVSHVAGALTHVDTAVAALGADGDAATEAADAAIAEVRRLERAYYEGMAELLAVGDRNERIARRELYRSCARLGETVVDVAERVIYAVMKES
ncbi:MAG TPA: DUF47 family protein [Solirubrobacteraceae bacterium]|nr:DUF47 family protein [Solirubrobacteraceae bacterium]